MLKHHLRNVAQSRTVIDAYLVGTQSRRDGVSPDSLIARCDRCTLDFDGIHDCRKDRIWKITRTSIRSLAWTRDHS